MTSINPVTWQNRLRWNKKSVDSRVRVSSFGDHKKLYSLNGKGNAFVIITELIEKKMNGLEHTADEIDFLVDGLVKGTVADYQMTAWMMAICCRGMTSRETALLTIAMMNSGDIVDLSELPGVKVDKHSTGGVGDTTTLIVAPLVAACGGTVAKMSGRGLAHSGGTLDKLESVPGVCIEQSLDRFKQIVRSSGLCVVGQSGNLVPADKKMYALRDVSATVKSIPLIASSIMSKKLAAGAEVIVLDVKTGNGAFMETVDDARLLAQEMVEIGKQLGRATAAVITDMNRPLGMAVGNGLEMREAIQALKNEVPYSAPLMQVSFVLASNMLKVSRIAKNDDEAFEMLEHALSTGEAFRRLRMMLQELGGDVRYVDEPDLLVKVKRVIPVYPKYEGYIGGLNAKSIGISAMLLGAGREKVTDMIDPAVGILMWKRYGDYVSADEPFAYMYVNDESRLIDAEDRLRSAVTITESASAQIPMIYDTLM